MQIINITVELYFAGARNMASRRVLFWTKET